MTKVSKRQNSLMKIQSLRNNEYYDMQNTFDKLYQDSKNGKDFVNLMELISSEGNIKLAFRNIKNNTGSNTKGTDDMTIADVKARDVNWYITKTQKKLKNYHPQSVRRVFIPKPNGKQRPLGIPTIEDRLIQQSIKQVLEPIAEAQFHESSYAFRPNRSTRHAIARFLQMVNVDKLHYVVDVDIKGFFDNVDHGKLLKQLWAMGIRDKQLICVISKMLKAPIEGEGIPEKGTPQGGILSPLLSNIVLNELDWWIESQWTSMPTRHDYTLKRTNKSGRTVIDRSNQYRALRKLSNLKEIKIVRYADDLKILCRNREDAEKIFIAVKLWLKDRLGLEISPEKSKVTNLRRNYTEFLGFKFRLREKSKKWIFQSDMTDKAKEKAVETLKRGVIQITKSPTKSTVNRYNSMVLGLQNYYKTATNVSRDFYEIDFEVRRIIYNRLRTHMKFKPDSNSKTYDKLYGDCKRKKAYIADTILFPISYVQHESPLNLQVGICNYTTEGRNKIHSDIGGVNVNVLRHMLDNPIINGSTELNDNRLSLYCGQRGVCYVTKQALNIGNMELHHKQPRNQGGTDRYENLVFVLKDVHKLIHATQQETIQRYLETLKLDDKQLKRLNSLRKKVGNLNI